MQLYWRGIGKKEGQCGTYDDAGFVPDSVDIPQAEYDAWVAAQPLPVPVITQLQADIAGLELTSLSDAKTKLRAMLERVRSGER